MAYSTLDTGAASAPLSLPARFLGVVVSPGATFRNVAAHPRWFGMLALTTVLAALLTTLPMTTEEGRQAALDAQVAQMESWGFTVTDEQYDAMQQRARVGPYTTFGSIVVVAPVVTLVLAGVLFVVFSAILGGEARFRQLFAVVVHAGAISTLQAAFTGPLNYVRGTMTSATNLAVLAPAVDEGSFAGRVLGGTDVFLIWYCVVLAIGLGILYRRRTRPIAVGLLAVYALIVLAAAGVVSLLGSR